MPTSSRRLFARATAYLTASEIVNKQADDCDDPLESEELYKVAKTLWIEYGRYIEVANKRAEKEQGLEHRRNQV